MAREIVSFPINSMVIFHSFLYVYQRVVGFRGIGFTMALPWLYHRTSSPSAGLPAGSPQGGRGPGRRGATRGAPDAEFIGSSPRKNRGNRVFSLRNHGDFSWFSLLNGRSMLVYVEQCFLSTGGTTLWLVIVLWCLNAGSPIPFSNKGGMSLIKTSILAHTHMC